MDDKGTGTALTARAVTQGDWALMREQAGLLARWLTWAEGLEERFWLDVQPSPGCWIWRGPRTAGCYGAVRFRGQPVYAHRAAWQLAYGPIPDGLFVCHMCDNPPCVNPAHLFLGTQRDNLRDMARKGRWRNASARLTTETAAELTRRYEAGGITQRALGREYGLSQPSVSEAIHSVTWRTR